MLNTGLFSINTGKCNIMTIPLIYHEQLENISKQINNIINEIIQQKQMIQQQCFVMQNQMINQINMNNLQMQDSKPKMNICFVGDTINEGVFSLWKGQHQEKLLHALFNGTYLLIMSTISLEFFKSSINWFAIFQLMYDMKPFVYSFVLTSSSCNKLNCSYYDYG